MERVSDLEVKLKAEYSIALNWILPFPSDWRIPRNVTHLYSIILWCRFEAVGY